MLGEVEEAIETGEVVLADDDMFAIDGVSVTSPLSAFSDEERDDSELDEGIHIPGKIRSNKPVEVITLPYYYGKVVRRTFVGCSFLASWYTLARAADSWRPETTSSCGSWRSAGGQAGQ